MFATIVKAEKPLYLKAQSVLNIKGLKAGAKRTGLHQTQGAPDEAARRIWAKLAGDIPNGLVLEVGDVTVHDEVLGRVSTFSQTTDAD